MWTIGIQLAKRHHHITTLGPLKTRLREDEGCHPGEAQEAEGVEEATQPRQQVQEDTQLAGGVDAFSQHQAPHLAAS